MRLTTFVFYPYFLERCDCVAGGESTHIYRWIDENGQVHFSEKKENPVKTS